MQVDVIGSGRLRFDDGNPVRAASGIARLGDGWLVAQDDSTFGAWWRPGSTTPLRLFPPIDGHDHFSEAAGTKKLKPDLEAACEVTVSGRDGALLLGSGSTGRRMRAALALHDGGANRVHAADLTELYRRVAAAFGLQLDQLNLEGATVHGEVLRWFNRGNLQAGIADQSIDVDLTTLLAVLLGEADPASVDVANVTRFAIGSVGDVGLAVTDAVALPDGTTLISAAAEDTPNAVDDGPVVAAALAVKGANGVVALAAIPHIDGGPQKVEGLALGEITATGATVLAVVDADEPDMPSLHLTLAITW